LLHWQDGKFILEEVAPGFTPQEVMALGDMEMTPAANVKNMA
jgi:acyl CoA:acetate/3-ketoacid CoA transferase beta subunit